MATENFDAYKLLGKIDSPSDLKALAAADLPLLAKEIRQYLSYRVRENGGHLSSNLGVVELTMAIHRVFSTPQDHVIFDVGHQSYVHKLLTGRKEQFDTLRQAGGLSGFTKREESEHDAFGAGHSSTAISAAIGMATADALNGSDAYTVAVVGDGALTGGLAYEGLNNCRGDLRLIIVINENEMSISPNTGGLSEHLSRIRSSKRYIKAKAFTARTLRALPLIGKPLYVLLRFIKKRVKRLVYQENLFEQMGLRYYGPLDGNDIEGLVASLSYAKQRGGSVVLHVKTKKGMGDKEAEASPDLYHGVAPQGKVNTVPTFSEYFGRALCRMAKDEPDLCAITAAMSYGTGLEPFRVAYPKRFFDVGIAEGHAVTFAAGLGAGGKIPVVALYSTFLQRAYDNVLHDAALQHLPLILAIDRAGFSAADGPTHHGVYDVSLLSGIAGVRIFAPVTGAG
ncbi:MAG: 1-deoxy-D-xylulose-5-phosphate synthase [Clostridia bacterium]|nr:1-deoxy-D-xylulose-5-phosphate synthase [Clostridia bacterium]